VLDYAFNKYNPDKKINIVIGILRTDVDGMFKMLDYAVNFLKDIGITVNSDDYEESRFKGFVLCPPKGKNKSQDEIRDTFVRFLDLNYPTVLYQLPQVTENETTPDTLEFLVEEYANLYMMKDSSGDDIIARSERDYHKLILVRGAEGGYSDMLKKSGGFYDGFLLSTGNSFPKELKDMCDMIDDDNEHDADELSHRLTLAINEVFDLSKNIKNGNAFTNSNKMIEHIRKFGDEWKNKQLPRIHSGENIPKELLEKTEDILKKYKFY
jgi:dihydrodipicolinate synthase/N-acetylneuraminate lyase